MKRIKNPLRKRIWRQFKQDAARYIALFLFMTLVIGFVSGFLVSDRSMQIAYAEGPEKYHLEDGHFATDMAMTEAELSALEEDQGITVYPLYYKDKKTDKDRDIRLYMLDEREANNSPCIMEGELPQNSGEIAIDRLYAENNGIAVGDDIAVADQTMKVTATVALPDYSCLFRSNSDMMFDASSFTYGLVSREDFDRFDNTGLIYNYIWYNGEANLSETAANDKAEDILDYLSDYFEEVADQKADEYAEEVEARLEDNPMTVLDVLGIDMMSPTAMQDAEDRLDAIMDDEDELEAFLDEPDIAELTDDIEEPEVNYLTDFLQRYDNHAITFTGEDMGGDLIMIIVLVYVLMAVIGFIYAVTCRSTVEREASAIGTLRASGFTRGEMVRHYLVLPLVSSIIAALVGNIMGYTVFNSYAANLYYHSYSLPTYEIVWNADAFWMTTVWPLLIILVVNLLVLGWSLRIPPLQFLRGELKSSKKKKVMNLKRGSFFHRFRLRVIFQNLGSYLVLFFGLFFASFILIFGTTLNPLLNHFSDLIVESQISDYQYVLKAEEETDTPGVEKFCLNNLLEPANAEEIMVYGIEPDSRYVDIDLAEEVADADEKAAGAQGATLGSEDNPIPAYLSNSYLKKFGYEVGDVITLDEKYGNKTHTIKVVGEYRYDAALVVFMDRAMFNRVFDEDRDYFSGYFSNEEITDIDEEYIAGVIDRDDLTAVAKQMQDSLGGMMDAVKVFCVAIYILVIFLLTKTIVDRNAKNIGLLKILGYRNREAGRLYNTATVVIVVLSLLLMQPLVQGFFSLIWDRFMVSRMNGYLVLWMPPWMTPFLVACGVFSYLVLYPILMRRIRKIPPGVVLKGQE